MLFWLGSTGWGRGRRWARWMALVSGLGVWAACAQLPLSGPPEGVGTPWQGPESDRQRLVLAPDGTLSGHGGCNAFSGPWQAQNGQWRLGPLAATRRLCLGPVQAQEDRFLRALEATRGARTEAGALLLLDAEGQVLMRLSALP